MKKLDFLAIGDIVVDAFIELENAEVHCDINNTNCTICMKFADKIPYKNLTTIYAVGNSANAATSAARLGLSSGLVANVGDDQNGKECLETLSKNGVENSLVEIQDGLKTNYHFVLNYGPERTILIKHEPFTYDFKKAVSNLEENPSWIYLSSVAENTLSYHEQIADYLEENMDIKLAFQPGTFQMKLGTEKLSRLYKRTEIFFCNKEEAQRILNSKEEDVKILMTKIHELGPKMVSITDGPSGAYGFDGSKYFFIPMYPDPKPPVSRTGAGDAFSSTVTAALAIGKTLAEAMLWGPVNSMNVVQHIGAQTGLLTKDEIESFLSKAPSDYKVKEI